MLYYITPPLFLLIPPRSTLTTTPTFNFSLFRSFPVIIAILVVDFF